MNRYDITWTLGMASLTSGVYLTVGLGPALMLFGGLLMVASMIANRGRE